MSGAFHVVNFIGSGLDPRSEICDGDPPHQPAGCPFQAWSLAEAIRAEAIRAEARWIDPLLGA